mmetsp:Transcript_102002/g.287968  ORF Transcript_102002/g.287968 Transcript_102002/m.287968 type:complete len:394 (+) Transcript_102002:259-1440(+)
MSKSVPSTVVYVIFSTATTDDGVLCPLLAVPWPLPPPLAVLQLLMAFSALDVCFSRPGEGSRDLLPPLASPPPVAGLDPCERTPWRGCPGSGEGPALALVLSEAPRAAAPGGGDGPTEGPRGRGGRRPLVQAPPPAHTVAFTEAEAAARAATAPINGSRSCNMAPPDGVTRPPVGSWLPPPCRSTSSSSMKAARCRSCDCCNLAISADSSRSILSISWSRIDLSSSSCVTLSRTALFAMSCFVPSDLARLRMALDFMLRTLSALAATAAISASRSCWIRRSPSSRSWRTVFEEPEIFCMTTLCFSSIFLCCSSRRLFCCARKACSSATRRASSASFARRRSSLRRCKLTISFVFCSVSRIFLRVFSSSLRRSRIRFASKIESCSARFLEACAE